MKDSELIEHLHARGWSPDKIDIAMIREACAALASPTSAPVLANANRATVLVRDRNELHLKFNNDTELRQAYAELDALAAARR